MHQVTTQGTFAVVLYTDVSGGGTGDDHPNRSDDVDHIVLMLTMDHHHHHYHHDPLSHCSSQAGCAMGCVFCATGQMGFARQLSETEIFEQALRFAQELSRDGERLSNVVFMGMGEPLANMKR
jgi:hypothetical protein